jgi:hypothetical protein
MTANVLEELLVWRKHHNFMEQPQRDIVLQFSSVLYKPPKDIFMRLMVLAPTLQRTEIVEVGETERLVSRGSTDTIFRYGIHETALNTADFFAMVS